MTVNGTTLTSGTVPSGWRFGALAAGSSGAAVITSTDHPDGFGKIVKFALSTTKAEDGVAPSPTLWSLTDSFDMMVDMSVEAGAVNAYAYGQMQVNTDAGNYDYYMLYGEQALSPFPTDAYAVRLQSGQGVVRPNSATKNYVQCKIPILFTAAGSLTLSLSRPSFRRLPLSS